MLKSPRQLSRQLRWNRFRHRPLACLLRRCGIDIGPPNWRRLLHPTNIWPEPVRVSLEQLPDGFVTNWSVGIDSGQWIYERVASGADAAILECGCGLSTVLIALALKHRRFPASDVTALSLEHDREWLETTQDVLFDLELERFVKLVHAPIVRSRTSQGVLLTYDTDGFPRNPIDLLLIDGPPHHIGRGDVVPALIDHLNVGATIILDDAQRPSEQRHIRQWTANGWARLEGYLPIGHGLAVLTIAHDGSRGNGRPKARDRNA